MVSGKAMVLRAPGEALTLEQREVRKPKATEILFRNRATSVNYHDLINVEGGIPGLPYPRVPFSDGCGIVEEVGEEVGGLAPGDRIVPGFFLDWADGDIDGRGLQKVLGDQVDGTLQEYVVTTAASVVKAPAHLSDLEAATLGCAGLTAWRSVVVEADIRPGQTVLVQGTGGVSLFAAAFAKLAGATVIATSSSDEKLETAKALGADHLHNYRSDPDWEQFAMTVTNGRGVDLVVDVGGADTLPRAVRACRIGGHISMIGIRSGPNPTVELPIAYAFSKNLTIKGITVGSAVQLADMCRAIEAAKLRPVIDSEFAVEDTMEAIERMRQQRHVGKIVIRV